MKQKACARSVLRAQAKGSHGGISSAAAPRSFFFGADCPRVPMHAVFSPAMLKQAGALPLLLCRPLAMPEGNGGMTSSDLDVGSIL